LAVADAVRKHRHRSAIAIGSPTATDPYACSRRD
jgi:hypothetical protein